MTGLGRFLPLTRFGVSKNYVRNDVIRGKNCFATLLANINTQVCQPWQTNNTTRGENLYTTDTLAIEFTCTATDHAHSYSVRVYWLTTVWIYKVNCVGSMNAFSFKFFALRTKYSALNQFWLENQVTQISKWILNIIAPRSVHDIHYFRASSWITATQ